MRKTTKHERSSFSVKIWLEGREVDLKTIGFECDREWLRIYSKVGGRDETGWTVDFLDTCPSVPLIVFENSDTFTSVDARCIGILTTIDALTFKSDIGKHSSSHSCSHHWKNRVHEPWSTVRGSKIGHVQYPRLQMSHSDHRAGQGQRFSPSNPVWTRWSKVNNDIHWKMRLSIDRIWDCHYWNVTIGSDQAS